MHWKSFGWQLFPIYFHLQLHKNANNASFRSLKKKLDYLTHCCNFGPLDPRLPRERGQFREGAVSIYYLLKYLPKSIWKQKNLDGGGGDRDAWIRHWKMWQRIKFLSNIVPFSWGLKGMSNLSSSVLRTMMSSTWPEGLVQVAVMAPDPARCVSALKQNTGHTQNKPRATPVSLKSKYIIIAFVDIRLFIVKCAAPLRGRIQNFHRRGRKPSANIQFCQNFGNTARNWETFGSQGSPQHAP